MSELSYGSFGAGPFGSGPFGGPKPPRLDWDAPGSAFLESGLDRGVLYPRGGDGVPWDGLVVIDEVISGGEHTPYYYDGVKYKDLVASESYQATVEAFSAPPEFQAADGMRAVKPGLYLSHQRRTSFGLTYRTLITGEFDQALGYKLNLVYNLTAYPSPKTHTTRTATLSAPTKTWTVYTVPPSSSQYKPTAHLVVDSRYTHPDRLADLEDVLYGASDSLPRLPPPEEVQTILLGNPLDGKE